MFAVSPKLDCPHVETLNNLDISNYLNLRFNLENCHVCNDSQENWLCLHCLKSFCSRYINAHMRQHNEDHSSHSIVISYTDGSIWCYSCESYIDSPELVPIRRGLAKIKFPEDVNHNEHLPCIHEEDDDSMDDNDDDLIVKDISQSIEDMQLHDNNDKDDCEREDSSSATTTTTTTTTTSTTTSSNIATTKSQSFTYEDLVIGLKNKTYQRIVFLTGAGISVAAGIPDFRTPGTGLYSKLKEFNLPYPEAIFQIDYLQANPLAFYKIANGFLTMKPSPVNAHKFIKKCYDEEQLLMNFTQNIDGLELEAGLPLSYLVQAHGHMRSAHCHHCKSKASIDAFFEYVEKEEVLYCTQCHDSDKPNATTSNASPLSPGPGIIKPEIILFGENLPILFFEKMNLMKNADLIFVMGTSLKVFPFTALLSQLNNDQFHPNSTNTNNSNTMTMIPPLVVLNRELPSSLITTSESTSSYSNNSRNILFIPGDIEENITKLALDINWDLNK